jgi:hypothetical protein
MLKGCTAPAAQPLFLPEKLIFLQSRIPQFLLQKNQIFLIFRLLFHTLLSRSCKFFGNTDYIGNPASPDFRRWDLRGFAPEPHADL